MEYDLNYEINKYINQAADDYISFKDFLKKKNLTLREAQQIVNQFREKFFSLLAKYSIGSENFVVTCYDLMEKIYENPENKELHYIYLCIITDFGLLNNTNVSDNTDERKITNYFRQEKNIKDLSSFLESHQKSNEKLYALREYLKKPRLIKDIDCKEETDFLYNLTIQHTFWYENMGNNIYKDNLNALLMQINSDEKLKSAKPYIIYAALARKHGMMQKRKHFLPNIKALFQYQDYNIHQDNGKNFNYYQSSLELYDHLQRSYSGESGTDMNLCNFCFAYLSPLSEWYYMNCEPNEDIPMNIKRKIATVMPKAFPEILSYQDYEKLDDAETQIYINASEKLMEKMIDLSEYMI